MKWNERVEATSDEKLEYLNQLGENNVREQQILYNRKHLLADMNRMTVEQEKREVTTSTVFGLVTCATGALVVIAIVKRLII